MVLNLGDFNQTQPLRRVATYDSRSQEREILALKHHGLDAMSQTFGLHRPNSMQSKPTAMMSNEVGTGDIMLIDK